MMKYDESLKDIKGITCGQKNNTLEIKDFGLIVGFLSKEFRLSARER